MLRMRLAWPALVLVLASCTSFPRTPPPEDVAAKRFDSVPDKAVIYLFRPQVGFVGDGASIMLDEHLLGTTYPGTYLRLEIAPGRHRLAGFAGDSGHFDFDAQPGRLYFIEQVVMRLMHFDRSHFQVVPEGYGRQVVQRSELIFSR